MNEIAQNNLAETLARELKQPLDMSSGSPSGIRRIALPSGWDLNQSDDEKYFSTPRRKVAKVRITDTESFIDYVKRHGSLTDSTLWCTADYRKGEVDFVAILNDHGEDDNKPAWRDHRATYAPEFSEEWARWTKCNNKPFSQAEFATFIEDNLKDIPSVEGQPTGAQMLEMALTFEANQDKRFKSAIRLQSGGVQMSFVEDDDAQTIAKMQVFDRFSIGVPVFWNGDAYQVDARLRYRVREGVLTFWYDLIRRDKVLEDAAQTMIANIRTATGTPFFFGEPFAQ